MTKISISDKRKHLELKRDKCNKIIDLVNAYFDVECRTFTRKRNYIFPRQLAIYLILENINISLNEVSKLFKSKTLKHLDHATILHARNRLKGFLDTNDKLTLNSYNDLKLDAKLISKLTDKEIEMFKIKDLIMDNLNKMDKDTLNKILKYTTKWAKKI